MYTECYSNPIVSVTSIFRQETQAICFVLVVIFVLFVRDRTEGVCWEVGGVVGRNTVFQPLLSAPGRWPGCCEANLSFGHIIPFLRGLVKLPWECRGPACHGTPVHVQAAAAASSKEVPAQPNADLKIIHATSPSQHRSPRENELPWVFQDSASQLVLLPLPGFRQNRLPFPMNASEENSEFSRSTENGTGKDTWFFLQNPVLV